MVEFAKRESHPSHGVINIHRVSGHTRLFRSALTHQHYITLSVCKATVTDSGLASDFLMPGEEIVEVAMSETQFARMITSMNMGSGSPVTIRHLNHEQVPEPPSDDRKSFVSDSHGAHIRRKNAQVESLVKQLQAMRENKQRPTLIQMDEMIHSLSLVVGNFASDEKFYREQFVEEIEKVVDEAKTEIECHISQTVARVGLESIKDQLPRLTEQRWDH